MLIPVGDASKGLRFSLVTWLLITANVAVYLYEINISDTQLGIFYFQWGLVPQLFVQAISHPFSLQSLQIFSTLISSQFVHLSFMHILGNMLFLYTFGQNVEQRLGGLGFLAFYLLCGVAAGLAEAAELLITDPAGLHVTMGASGAIAGTLGAYLIFSPMNRVYLRLFPLPWKLPVPAFILIVFWFGQQLLAGLDALSPEVASQSGVAFWAHIGGFVFGMLIALFFIIPKNQRQSVVRALLPVEQGPVAMLENVGIGVGLLLIVGILGSVMARQYTGDQSAIAYSPPPTAVSVTAAPTAMATATITLAPTVNAAREVSALRGHTRYISSVAFSPDGKLLASASADRTIRLWDTTTFKPLATLSGHTDVINTLAFSPDGSILASGSVDMTVKLWNVQSHRLIATLRGHRDDVTSLSFLQNGTILASASTDRTVRLWNTTSFKLTMTLPAQPGGVMAVAYSPDGTMLATAGKEATVRLYTSNGKQLAVLPGNTGSVYGLAWSHDNTRLASAGGDHKIRIWDIKTRTLISTLVGHDDIAFGVQFSLDDSHLISTSRDQSVIVWDLTSGSSLTRFTPGNTALLGLAINPPGTLIATGGADKIVHVWSMP